ncbi:DNA polymerase III subunit epsilon [endosymbiont of Pachyrhynchus infernalis]|uniref:DNA polymerase III subunit epsilon n=1 Tax=endosymbiont of Pachyrhynchus infernalis TaxID=1971488 RepID=UPI000DC73D96|nr:DNA polymerase III subunit epsilon [endosymbiont of Pachyrhynchus infernalis]BBA84896.1 DNA polymerase III subunit epsilon [endosymbiont of Pachyrhynchus infernalis]
MLLKRIVLDIETTGINKYNKYYYIGHKIIEIGAIEITNFNITNNKFHSYINPNRNVDKEAYNIHGIDNKLLYNKPLFSDIVDNFIKFIYKSELIIHNAKFDISFINYELNLINYKISNIKSICNIIDTLSLARKKFPGKKNNLDSLCDRFNINRENRNFHGALIDAILLAKVFLLLIKKQSKILFETENSKKYDIILYKNNNNINYKLENLIILKANKKELNNHINLLNFIKIKYLNK